MRATFRRAVLTLVAVATAFAVGPTATAYAAPDQPGSVAGFTMLANTTKPTLDMSKAKVLTVTDRSGTNASVTCYYMGPYPPYYLDLLCNVTSGVVSVYVDCSNGVRLYSTPMAAVGQYYGRATCGPPAYAVALGSITLA
jgi:hypothetical protein